jgi:FAD/FMN-containing dehydrogenase
MISDEHILALRNIAGPGGSTSDGDDLAPHLKEWRDKFQGHTPLMVSPTDTATTVAIVGYCAKHSIEIVPQGGNTGLVGGGIPGLDGREQILLSTKKLRARLTVDSNDMSVTACAGFTVSELQAAAAEHDLLFPLSLASEGSCTVGGVISTNAGGVHVLRYGTTRALTLGLQAVLPTGDILDDLSSLRKDNTGYDLSQLLVGAEGTLGVITAATFRLFPPERQRRTCWLAVASPTEALALLRRAREATDNRVSVFELMPRIGLDLVLRHIPDTRDPLDAPYPWYVLVEAASARMDGQLEAQLDLWLEVEMNSGAVLDGLVAGSLAQAEAFWRLRESMSEAQKHEGGSIKHDISVPVSSVPAFLDRASTAVLEQFPGSRLTPFGHLGDGNIHFNVMQPSGGDKSAFLAQWEAMNRLVHDIVTDFGGSISAEHGIGTLKRDELSRLKPPTDIAAMKAIKQALDPKGIMNPGALLRS